MQYTLNNNAGPTIIVRMSGRISFMDAPQFPKAIDDIVASGSQGVSIDLAEVDFIDSTGMSLFVHIYDAAKAKARPIVLCNAGGTVREALLRAGFDTLFEFR